MAEDTGPTSPLWIFKLFTPKTQKVRFEEIFKNSIDEETQGTFRTISNARDEMKSLLDSEAIQNAFQGIEKYLTYLYGTIKAVEVLPPDFSKYLRFIWTTPIAFKYSTNPMVNASFQWELVMVLMAYGVLHRNMAHIQLTGTNVNSDEFDEKSKVIANYLCKASGIFEYISQRELARWPTKPEPLIAESMDPTYMALSTLCLAEAQEITIKKGLLKKTSPSTIAKLCVDVSQKYEHCYSLLKGVSDVLPSLLNYLSINSNLWKAVTLKLMAQDFYEKGNYGIAVQYINAAASLVEDKRDATIENFLNVYNSEKLLIRQLQQKFTNENDSIYYEIVPKEPVQYPEAKCLMKTVAYNPPEAFPVQINLKKGSDCCVQ